MTEANFCLGNGYLGLRSATEEKYLGETRDLLVAGTFDRFSEEEVTELPNAADVTNIEITLNGSRFDLTQGATESYRRTLDLKTGLLLREVTWVSPKGEKFDLLFERLVSLRSYALERLKEDALSSEGYKGHTFWDTEIFLLP